MEGRSLQNLWDWSDLIQRSELSPQHVRILLALARHVGDPGWPDSRKLSRETRTSRRAVRDAMVAACQAGWLTIQTEQDRVRCTLTLPAKVVEATLRLQVARGGEEVRRVKPKAEPLELLPPPEDDPQDSRAQAFEEAWKVLRRGSKKVARREYMKAVPSKLSQAELMRALQSYVRHEVREDFHGCHLERWIREERWHQEEERLDERGPAPEVGTLEWAQREMERALRSAGDE